MKQLDPGEIRVLIVEDVPSDAALMEDELAASGMRVTCRRVETEGRLAAELSDFRPDIILSDYSLPSFDGASALAVALERSPETPFIFVTGALGEDRAADLLKSGATDFVLKDRLSRLPQAVARALSEVEERRRRRKAEFERVRLFTAIEEAAEGIQVIGREGMVKYVNPAFCSMTGYSREEMVGRDIRILRGDEDRAERYNPIWEAVLAGRTWSGTVSTRRKDGTKFIRELTVSPVRDDAGAIVEFVGVSRDVTRIRQLEDHLHQAEKMEALGTLSGGIAHDFNNILAIIMGNVEMAMDDVKNGDLPERSLERIFSATKRGRDLVREILTFSRKSHRERTPTDLVPVLEETFKLLRSTLPTTIRMSLEMESPSATILGDPVKVQQILVNLATNAAHAMAAGRGSLSIALYDAAFRPSDPLPEPDMKPGEYVRLVVADTGAGMTEKVRGRIFEPFFTTKRAGEGTGMGLSVVYGIVKGYNGAIRVESAPGKGSTFTVYLPKIEGAASAEGRAKRVARGNQERLLFIDDERDITKTAESMLQRLGYRVTALTDGREALKRFTEAPNAFDVVVTDQTMPDITGLSLAEEMLKLRRDLPIILCTGHSEAVSPEKAREAGIREFLMKPLARSELTAAIRRALSGREEGRR